MATRLLIQIDMMNAEKNLSYERVELIGKGRGTSATQKGYVSNCIVCESLSKLSLSNQTASKQRRYTRSKAKLPTRFLLLPL